MGTIEHEPTLLVRRQVGVATVRGIEIERPGNMGLLPTLAGIEVDDGDLPLLDELGELTR